MAWLLLVPPVAADHDAVHYAQRLQTTLSQYATGIAENFNGIAPECDEVGGSEWLAHCQDGTTELGCGQDNYALYRCRLIFEGGGGEIDGGAAGGFAQAATTVWDATGQRTSSSAQAILEAGDPVRLVASEYDAWEAWGLETFDSTIDFALAAKQPYQNTATGLTISVVENSQGYVQEVRQETEDAVLESVHEALWADLRLTAEFDSGPVTLSATNRRPADDPCSPGTGLRLFGSDCQGPIFFDATARGTWECNAYTSIVLAQPCGGHISRDWNWESEAGALYPSPLQKARLVFQPDGRVTVHDALGVLHCNAPANANGYWLQYAYVEIAANLFDESNDDIENDDSNAYAPFGNDAGTCIVTSLGGGRYHVSYDVTYYQKPLRASGTFTPEGPAQHLADCGVEADTHSISAPDCGGVIYTGGG